MVLNYLPKTILRGTSQENVLGLLRSSACQLAKRSYSKSEAVTSSQPEYEINKPDSHRSCSDYANVKWDDLGFGHVPVDYMYVMKCSHGKSFSRGEITPYQGIELSPFSGVINYGQGLFEGLKAYQRVDGEGIMLFRPQENALRMQTGAERMCMPSLSVEQFVDAVKQLVSANKRWGLALLGSLCAGIDLVPPPGKGTLYVRPLLLGTGPLLGLAPAPEYTFLTYASPVGNYFKESVASISLLVDNETHRATPGGTGGVKTISNYGPVLKSQMKAKKEGYSDVLFLDSVEKKYIEESSACNIFIVKDNVISTPTTRGTILAGVTRKSIIEIARDSGYQVEERNVSVDELADADEVFCTGTAIGVPAVGSISYNGQRYKYRTGETTISEKLHKTLSGIQTGLIEDKMGWTITIE